MTPRPVPPWRILSVCQPFAGLIVDGFKPVENRSWSTGYRGPLLIHASGSRRWLTPDLRDWLVDLATKSYAKDVKLLNWLNNIWSPGGRFEGPQSAIVGRVELLDCPDADAVPFEALTPWHAQEGFCWSLGSPLQMATPLPCAGKLNLWKAPADLAKRIRRQFPDLP